MPDFLLPDLGEGLTEAEIVAWLVDVGDEVSIDQPVVEVETAKAVVEVPVPFAGRVMAVFGRPGESLAVGSPLITVVDNAIDVEAGRSGARVPKRPLLPRSASWPRMRFSASRQRSRQAGMS